MAAGSRLRAPGAEDFRALARSSPWLFTTLHFSHTQHGDGERRVEAWLDRTVRRVVVRSERGIDVETGVPYTVSEVRSTRPGAAPVPPPPTPTPTPLLRADGLVAERPDEWHVEHGDPMWRNYQWTAMLDPAELSTGVDVTEVAAVSIRGRTAWSATCRPLVGAGEDWDGGYEPRCGCCPLLDSVASRLLEYDDEPDMIDSALPTAYRVGLDVATGIVLEVAPLDGTGGSGLSNEIHAADEPLDAPIS